MWSAMHSARHTLEQHLNTMWLRVAYSRHTTHNILKRTSKNSYLLLCITENESGVYWLHTNEIAPAAISEKRRYSSWRSFLGTRSPKTARTETLNATWRISSNQRHLHSFVKFCRLSVITGIIRGTWSFATAEGERTCKHREGWWKVWAWCGCSSSVVRAYVAFIHNT